MEIIETFVYIGENRRADRPAIEQLFRFTERELAALALAADSLVQELTAALANTGVCADALLRIDQPETPCQLFCRLYARAAVVLQQRGGHQVEASQSMVELSPSECRAIYEYEEETTGRSAGELALLFMKTCCPAIDYSIDHWTGDAQGDSAMLAQRLTEFLEFAAARALPVDTRALIEAASKAGIPYLKLDRAPFKREPGDFRIRRNSLLKLGQGCHRHIVEGNLCIDRSSAHSQLLTDREEIVRFMQTCDLPLPERDEDSPNCSTQSRARRSARRLGYPLVIKSTVKRHDSAVFLNIGDEASLSWAFERAREHSRRVMIERQLPGDSYKLIIANRLLTGVIKLPPACSDARYGEEVSAALHPSIADAALRAASTVDIGLMVFTLVTTDVSLSPAQSGAAFVDLDVAPEPDTFLPPGSRLLAAAADRFTAWLFPPGSASRIPLVAVTGTNGKTTTSRMIRAILGQAGFRPGLACSEGVYIDGQEPVIAGDLSGLVGHYHLLGNSEIDCAVLETARGAVLKTGFGFDHCDVAVCLNVTRDHLEDCGIDTIEQMAALKRSIADRARGAVVLNADDPMCLAMAPFANAGRLCLVSTERSIQALESLDVRCDCYVVVEEVEGDPQLILYDCGHRQPIIPVNDIPAAYGGMARHNLSNALHACAACHLLDIGIDGASLAAGLRHFQMNFDNTPGRMNFYDELPFRILLDYAHNPGGISRLCEFADQLPAEGRKLVAFSAASYNPEDIVRGNARAAAGHFDHYVCYNFLTNINKGDDHIPHVLAETLLGCGVAASNISVASSGLNAIDSILNMAAPGDLVVFLSGYSDRREIWERITTHV